MWSPDKEGEEDHDDDLEEDHGEDMTAGLQGLFPSTCHVCSNTLQNTNILGYAVLFFHSVSTLLCI